MDSPAMGSKITSPSSSGSANTSADERYRPLFALSPQPAYVYDCDTLRFLEVNEAAVRSYGWTRQEFLAMSIRDIRPPQALAQMEQLILDAEAHDHFTATTVHRTKSGRTLHVELSTYRLEFDGHPARMVLVHDITEREATSRALAASEEKYRTVIEQLQDVFFRTDAAGYWTFLNQAWTSLTGHPVDSTVGTHFLSYVYPSDRATLLDTLRPLMEGELETATAEVRYFQRAGGYRWFEVDMRAIFDDQHRYAGTMGILRDVTERHDANEERQRLATNIRQLLDASGEGIYGLDPQGRITFVNKRGSEMLGYTADELVGKPKHDLTHHSRPDGTPYPIAECPIQRAAIEGVPCEVDDEVMWRKDGTPLQVEYAASPIRDNGRLMGAVVNFRDVTARKRAELELILARDAAEAANRAKSDFLARMSHELRTPLNSIIGFANVLLRNRNQSLKTEELSYLRRIATNGNHLLGLINDILDLSKIEAGRMTLELSTVMLDTLVRETVDELEAQTKDKPVALRTEIPTELRSIETDVARMKQVLINLIGNALKFTGEGEVVVTLEADAEFRPTRLTVRDTGIGIPADRLAAIFSVFEQADSTTARRFGGTGLGLAISRSLCELMGHHLDVESTEGVGTTMIIRLGSTNRTWRRSTPMANLIVPRDAERSPTAPSVLVVDQDADSRLLLGQFLEDAGCRVIEAVTGIEALRTAREQLPDLIFLELRLPKISGFDVFRILQSDETLRNTPIVIASVSGSESRGALAGAAAIIDKPISRAQVEDIVARWLPAATRR